MAKKKQVAEQKEKRYFATCTYCGKIYESDKEIKPCCASIMLNDRIKITSTYICQNG